MNDPVVPFLPMNPVNVTVTATSSAFVAVNTSSAPKVYAFISGVVCHIKRGTADIGPATADDFRLAPNTVVLFRLDAGEGVRAIRTSGTDQPLQIGDTDV